MATGRDVDGLTIPAPRRGRAMLNRAMSSQSETVQHSAKVLAAPSGDTVTVGFASTSKVARVAPTAKTIQAGDRVTVEKRGGTWWVVEADTWHEPPAVSQPPTGSVPSAGTVSGGSILRVLDGGDAPSSGIGSTLSQLQVWATSTRAYLNRDHYWRTNVENSVNGLIYRVESIQSRLNSNASAQNSSRTVIEGTRNSVSGIYDGVLQDRVIKR